MIANSIMAYMAMFRNGQDRSLQSKTLGPALTPNSYFLTPNLPFLRYYGQHRTIPALRLKHRSGSCGTASALPKCSIMSGCGTRIVLRFAVSATGGAHLCSIQYYLRFWLSSCRTSLAVSALRIMRYCPRLFNAKSGCVCRNRRYFRLFRYTLAQRRNFPSFRSCIRINSSIIHKYSKSMYKYRIQHFAARWLPAPPEIVHFSSLHFTVFPDILTP